MRTLTRDKTIPLPLMAIVAAALAVRAIVIFFLPDAIDVEGTEYARIAQNILSGAGYVGLAQEGTQLLFPPLFPFLIAAGSLLTGDVELAGQIISVIAGGLTPLPVYFIAEKMYGRQTGLIAAAIMAFHPWLVYLPAPVFCELVYLALLLSAVCFAVFAVDDPSPRYFILSGVLYGLAYLVRPEAAAYAAVAAVILALSLLGKRHLVAWARFARVGLLIVSFICVAAPYIIWLSGQSGHFRLEGKSPLNMATEMRIQNGEPIYSAYFAIDTSAEENGMWNRPHIEIIRSHSLSTQEKVGYFLAKAGSVAANTAKKLVTGRLFGSPLLFALAVIGIFARPWSPTIALHQLHFLAMLALTVLSMFFIFYDHPRFYIVALALMVVWAAAGLQKLVRWAKATGRALGWQSRSGAVGAFVGLATFALLLALPGITIKPMVERSRTEHVTKTAGKWLRENAKGPIRILDSIMIKSFHAGAEHVWLPYADEATALRYIEKKNITHVAVRTTDAGTMPYIGKWLENGIPLPQAKLVYSYDLGPGNHVKIYEIGK